MHGTTAGLRTDATAQLADLERRKPEWQAWLRLLGVTLRAFDDPAWSAPLVPHADSGPASTDPLLNGRVLVVDARRLGRLVHDLAETTGTLAGYQPSADDAVQLIRGILGRGIESGALETVARLAALPLLHSCGRLLRNQVPGSWSHGYCPICGSWPLLAELRSLERARYLRCGRCGGDWRVSWLCCAYCGETDHERLGTLVLEGEPEPWSVETCSQCSGYLKSVTTLQAIPPFELLLRDLETVELDVAARDRGFVRPDGDGFPLDLLVTTEAS